MVDVTIPERDVERSGVVSLLTRPGLPAQVFLASLIVGLGSVIAFSRLPEKAQGTIWAEDGGVFLRDALSGNGWAGIFSPYEGYIHVIPRLGANVVASFVPVGHFAVAMNFLSCVVVALVALMVFHLSKPFAESVLIRLCWASVAILVAPGPLETLANFANVHWYLLWLTPWLLLKPAKNRGEGLFIFFASMFVSLTEIVSLLFAPLFLYKLLDRAYWPARAGLVLGLICQVATTLSFPRSPSSGYPVNFQSVLEGWFLNSSSALVYGDSISIIRNIQTFGPLPIVLAAAPFIVLFLFIILKGTPAHRLLAVVFLAASFGTWAAAQVANPQPFFDYASFDQAEWDTFFLSRYSTVPSMFLLALVPLAAGVATTKTQPLSAAILGAFVVLQLVYFFPSGVARVDGPVWKEGVSEARNVCETNVGLESAPIPIAPRGWAADRVELPCSSLLPNAK